MRTIAGALFILLLTVNTGLSQDKQRARDYGISPGILQPGPLNAITDVSGVMVGHKTLIRGTDVRTGVTVIMPHGGDLFNSRVPAAVYVGNGFGKAVGFTQVQELGEIETPIGLTNTLSIHTVADAIADHVLVENENVRSVNPVVGETNDGWLNDIRKKTLDSRDVMEALSNASGGPVKEGNVGAGTGTTALGFKGGIGTSSRILPENRGGYTVGVLVQSNFGGILSIDGAPVGEELGIHYMAGDIPYRVDGSIMIIVATDAPLSDRNLQRLAKRAFLGVARTGGFASNGSGDYVIAFSTHPEVRRETGSEEKTRTVQELRNNETSPLFLAAVEATEEAILNSLFAAESVTGHEGRRMEALPVNKVIQIMRKHRLLDR